MLDSTVHDDDYDDYDDDAAIMLVVVILVDALVIIIQVYLIITLSLGSKDEDHVISETVL